MVTCLYYGINIREIFWSGIWYLISIWSGCRHRAPPAPLPPPPYSCMIIQARGFMRSREKLNLLYLHLY